MDRRTFLQLSGAGLLAVGAGISLSSCAYGELRAADTNGLRLPPGFSSRTIATSGQPVAGTSYVWHVAPDGGACFAAPDGGWIYVSNCEWVPGGASMVRFAPDGTIVEARRILEGTQSAINCAGGPTPWGTWLSCEEWDRGRVFECDPTGVAPAVVRPGLGTFSHEAAAVDPVGQAVYLTEDKSDSGFYRFRPAVWGDLSAGILEVMVETPTGLGWDTVPDPAATTQTVRSQVPHRKIFRGGEGTCYVDGRVYFTTKGDNRVWRYNPSLGTLDVVYDAATSANPVLTGVDNITARAGGSLYVAEDGGDMQIVRLRGRQVEPLLQLPVTGSEITGPAFSPDGSRLYFSSQRNPGATYEVTGPF